MLVSSITKEYCLVRLDSRRTRRRRNRAQEVEDLAVKVVDVEEVDQDVDLLVDEAPAGPEQEAEAGLLSESSNDTEETFIEQVENWSDDPVRMYLTQMGEIPLLTRAQEIFLARQIETTRAAFRGKLLECEYICEQAYKVLSRVHRGELPLIAQCKCR